MTERVLLVTGGTSGIGAAIARRAVTAGYFVHVTGRDPDRLDAFLNERDSDRLSGSVADAGDWAATRSAVADAIANWGRLDVAVANAGVSTPGDLADGDPEAWRAMVLTNVYGPAILARACLPAITATQGHIVLMGSTTGRKVHPGNLYSATKWAVVGLGESLRLQLAGTRVRVTVLSPGQVDTPLWQERPPQMIDPDDVAEALLWVLAQPPHIDVNELTMRATGQAF